jgi:hypothetical protein
MSSAASSTAAAAVADGSLTQAQADALAARVQAGDYGALFGGRGQRGGVRVEGLREAVITAAAQQLGITADELQTALRDGQTIAELAAAHNTTEQAVNDAALAAAKRTLDAAVANASITQAQADMIYARLQERGPLTMGRGGRHGDDAAPTDATPAPATATPNA